MSSMPHLNVLQCVPLIISITAMSVHHVTQAVLHVQDPHLPRVQLVIVVPITIGTLTEDVIIIIALLTLT
jgi:hypothetical protein